MYSNMTSYLRPAWCSRKSIFGFKIHQVMVNKRHYDMHWKKNPKVHASECHLQGCATELYQVLQWLGSIISCKWRWNLCCNKIVWFLRKYKYLWEYKSVVHCDTSSIYRSQKDLLTLGHCTWRWTLLLLETLKLSLKIHNLLHDHIIPRP